ncbi:hypothetical protein pmac_cds_912 [Pandoravirus macleodensis]|uniref:Uncharacterized protein n=1 Tax=Pandoravirus macleodensis TaxID=2107707 RepID=A0A2U7UGS8_9VIRU|nr:hypothetical protein pmac_cds_912 [Pandoravirus macleodensis]AVK77600.1 hypothetical protein pmac_cds_912 [Pandoravirus macleodensis]
MRCATTAIDVLPDDLLYHIVDAFLDDCSLGACLLAWRRFHVLGPDRLLQRKYHLATSLALCAAGDAEGLDYYCRHAVSKHPDVFSHAMDRSHVNECIQIAQAHGRARMVMQLMRAVEPIERFSLRQWSVLALDAALRDRDDPDLVWLCRPENRPTERWDDATLVCACARAIQSKRPADAVVDALDVLEARTGFSVTAPRDAWSRLAATPAPTPISINGIVRAVYEAVEMQKSQYAFDLRDLVRSGHWRLVRDLLGDERLARLFLAQGDYAAGVPTGDADQALWFYVHVHQHQITKSRLDGLTHLASVVASHNRTDLFATVEAHVATAWQEHPTWTHTCIWGPAYVAASMAGHTASIEWVLGHQIESVSLHDLFQYYGGYDSYGLPERYRRCCLSGYKVRSPLVGRKDRRDLFDLLLDRRPRPGIPQCDIDARVDHMVDITVEHALSQGDLLTVRRVHLVEPHATEAAVQRMRK